jgi:hypothetical protein
MAHDPAPAPADDTAEANGAASIIDAHKQIRGLLQRLEVEAELDQEGLLLAELMPLMRAHFEEEEEPGGLYEELRADSPHRDGVITTLQSEHGRILHDAELLGQELEALQDSIARFQARKIAMIRALRRHERTENRLMFEGVNLDIGVGD